MQGIRDARDEGTGPRGAGDRRVRVPDEQAEIADLFARYADALDRRLQQGLATVHESATKIMRRRGLAGRGAEVAGHLREGVLGALRARRRPPRVLTHTDERYQALSLRMERMESAVRQLAEATQDVVRRANRRIAEQQAGQAHATQLLERAGRSLAPLAPRVEAIALALGRQQKGHRQDLARFAESTARAIGEVHRRSHQGLRSEIEDVRRSIHGEIQRLEAAVPAANRGALDVIEESIRREIQEVRSDKEGVAERAGRVLEGLRTDMAGRMDRATRSGRETTLPLVTELATRQAGQHNRGLETITRSLQILLDSIRRSGETQATAVERALRASAGRQEAVLEEALSALRTSMDELTGVYATGTPGNGDTRTAGAALTRRLRGMEQRLAELTRELVGDPHASG